MFEYDLAGQLEGHSNDVRCVASNASGALRNVPPHALFTASRDLTLRCWLPQDESIDGKFPIFRESFKAIGHDNFIFSMLVMPSHERFPDGFILTGSSDKSINVYDLKADMPALRLRNEHSNTVCALANLMPSGDNPAALFCSTSWDGTGIIWRNFTPAVRFQPNGSSSALWCCCASIVNPYNKNLIALVTGGADKLIRVWPINVTEFADEKCLKIETTAADVYHHQDVVRSVTFIKPDLLATCGNDGTVCLINVTSTAMSFTATVATHMRISTSFLYDLSAVEDTIFVSGEDGLLFVVGVDAESKVLTLRKKVELPSVVSVWCVSALPNLFGVDERPLALVGCNDNCARILSAEPAAHSEVLRVALTARALEQAATAAPPPSTNGSSGGDDLDVNKLPNEERLSQPGNRHGQTILIRHDVGDGVKAPKSVHAYHWDAVEAAWQYVGEMQAPVPNPDGGGAGASQNGASREISKGKQLCRSDGKYYDEVVDIDLEETGAKGNKYELGFDYLHPNAMGVIEDDSFDVAASFLERNQLPVHYLEEIATFIKTKRADRTKVMEEKKSVVTTVGQTSSAKASNYNEVFPNKMPYISFIVYSQVPPNKQGLIGKVLQFAEAEQGQVSEDVKVVLQSLVEDLLNTTDLAKDIKMTNTNVDTILDILQYWKPERCFPIVDVLRCCFVPIAGRTTCALDSLTEKQAARLLMEATRQLCTAADMSTGSHAARITTMKCMTNACAWAAGQKDPVRRKAACSYLLNDVFSTATLTALETMVTSVLVETKLTGQQKTTSIEHASCLLLNVSIVCVTADTTPSRFCENFPTICMDLADGAFGLANAVAFRHVYVAMGNFQSACAGDVISTWRSKAIDEAKRFTASDDARIADIAKAAFLHLS